MSAFKAEAVTVFIFVISILLVSQTSSQELELMVELQAYDVGTDTITTSTPVQEGSPVTIYADIVNFGTVAVTGVPVYAKIPEEGYNSSTTVDLSAGETTTVTFPDTWIPSAQGADTITVYTYLPGDEDPSNDTLSVIAYVYSSDNLVLSSDTAFYSQENLVIPVYLSNPHHDIGGFHIVNYVNLNLVHFTGADTTSYLGNTSCISGWEKFSASPSGTDSTNLFVTALANIDSEPPILPPLYPSSEPRFIHHIDLRVDSCMWDTSTPPNPITPDTFVILQFSAATWLTDSTGYETYFPVALPCTIWVTQAGELFIRGDANADSNVGMPDAVYTLRYKFVPGSPPPPCMDAGDANDDGSIGMPDAVYTLRYKFVPGSPPPPSPFPYCGPDPTGDELNCANHPCWNWPPLGSSEGRYLGGVPERSTKSTNERR